MTELLQESSLITEYTSMAKKANAIDSELFLKYDVKRGLRDISGKGVLAGLTDISEVRSYIVIDNDMIPCEGKLFYRGYDIEDLVAGFVSEGRFGFEEITYLLLTGSLPDQKKLLDFTKLLQKKMVLPKNFFRDVIMKAPTADMMNMLARSVLMLYTYDSKADDIEEENVLNQSLDMIARFPLLSVLAYHAYNHTRKGAPLFIKEPREDYSIAENFLYLLRPDGNFTPLEAKLLDMALVLHAEHGGGNNSTFTTHVVTSSGTDTYSTVAASLGSLKGPRHGGANIKVTYMFEDMMNQLEDWTDTAEIENYLRKILHKEAFDRQGLIYGMGHAVYSLSDPRAMILKQYVQKLAKEKGMEKEYALYETVENLAPKIIASERKIYKGVSANVDFYSGLLYSMLDLPTELYTPMFAIARIAGWSAHRLEEISNRGKIIRPAYKSVAKHKNYQSLQTR